MEYPDDYKAYGTKIIKFDRDYKEEMVYTFFGLFPQAVNNVPVKYEGSEVLKVNAIFVFDRYAAGKFSSYDRYRGNYNNLKDTFAKKDQTKNEVKALMDDTGLTKPEAEVIQAGGFNEYTIG